MSNLKYVLFILTTTILALTTLWAQAEKHKAASAPSSSVDTWKEPYPGFSEHVFTCLGELTGNCQTEVFGRVDAAIDGSNSRLGLIFDKNSNEISPNCCEKLVRTGRRCSREILRDYLSAPQLVNEAKKELGKRETEVWDHCYVSHDDEVKALWRK